jgi:hypothetical protein
MLVMLAEAGMPALPVLPEIRVKTVMHEMPVLLVFPLTCGPIVPP